MMYKLSHYWNRIAYFVMGMGRRMIWDQTGRNNRLLDDMNVSSKDSKSIMCDK